MNIAVYTRKSVYSEKSDSVKNQDRMCRDYIKVHFPDDKHTFVTYEDEAFTGANTKRPALQKMMQNIENGLIDFLIVYQLDRLSRNVKDFSNIYSILEEKNVGFISVKENIDTSTPLGKAMMYVSVVFAQMERETIANRVYDNMTGLAEQGWWMAGNPPYGYKRCKVTENGKTHTTIEAVPEQVAYVTDIFKLAQRKQLSLQGLETYCKQNKIKTQNDKFMSTTQLHKLLTMPFCAPTTKKIYEHYAQKGCIMVNPIEQWDGSHGVMIYGRSTERNKKHTLQPPEKWRVAIGKHKSFIDEDLWLDVQQMFTNNKFDKRKNHETTLLKGVLRCKCGRLMQLARKKRVNGEYSTWYYCPKSNRQGKDQCDMSQINVNLLDNQVIKIFESIEHDPKLIYKYLEHGDTKTNASTLKTLQSEATALEKRINNLSAAISGNQSSTAIKYLMQDIETLDNKLSVTNRKIAELQATELLEEKNKKTAKEKYETITDLLANFDSFTADEKNIIAKKVIKKCVWDGETLFLTL